MLCCSLRLISCGQSYKGIERHSSGPLEDCKAIVVCIFIARHKPTSGHIETVVMEDRDTLSVCLNGVIVCRVK